MTLKSNKSSKAASKSNNFKKGREYTMWVSSRDRARKFGLVNELTVEDIVIPAVCPILGIDLIRGDGYRTDNSPSLHRIDSTKGYTIENTIVVSWRANKLISNATFEESGMILKWWTAHMEG